MAQDDERRQDTIMRELIEGCLRILEPRGFRIDGRGHSESCDWLRFHGPERAAPGQEPVYVVLAAHDRHEHALMIDVRSRDPLLPIHTPLRKWIYRYEPRTRPAQALRELTENLNGLVGSIAA